jgi:hypothetical protein
MRFTLLFLLALAANAAPITVTEPPDFPSSGGATLTLGAGQNVITGSVSGCPNCGGDFKDNFVLFIPAGLAFTSGSLSVSVDTGGGASPQGACFTNLGCFGVGAFSGFSGSVFTNGSWDFTATSPYSTLSVQVPGTGNYTLTVNVALDTTPGANVPEPGTFLTLGAGLGLVAFLRRRQN